MRLGEVVANAAHIERGDPQLEVTSIAYDSRAVKPGALFCALSGSRQDGARYISDALARGAVAVLSGESVEGNYPLLVAANPRRAMALVAAHFYHLPASRMTVVGVTGTNGKTTTAYLVEAMVKAAGRRAGLIGTVEQRFGEHHRSSTHTTPESVELQALLAEMLQEKVEIVAMEVSSHALVQHRVEGVRFRAAAFTQLTRDHLDYHGTMETYFESKAMLFREHLAAQGTAVINTADAWGRRLADELSAAGRSVWRFGDASAAELDIRDLSMSPAGFEGRLVTPMGECQVRSPLVGDFNVHNVLTAVGLALAAGVPLRAVVDALAVCSGAPGRLEPVADAFGRRVFVDYAHTDDALARVIESLRGVVGAQARIITVFGCGGDRDRGKRPLMGEAAGRGSDLAVVTSDNPRTESAAAIIADVVPGVERAGKGLLSFSEAKNGKSGYLSIEDRAEAIALAVEAARPGDVVLIAGKGHENYQIVGDQKRPFDDREIARRALEKVSS